MANLVAIVFLLSLIFTTVPDTRGQTEELYKTILSHQTKSPIDKLYADIQAAKTGYGKSPGQPKNIDKLYADIQSAKTGYGKSPGQPKNIDVLSHQTKSHIDKLYADIQAAKTGYGKSPPDQPADIQAVRTDYGKSPGQPKNIGKLYADIQSAKTGYGKSPGQPKNIDVLSHQTKSPIDKLYADIQAAKTGYGKSPGQPKNIDKLYADIQSAKTGYGKSPGQPKNIDVRSINLTVYHRYEDVDHIGKTMPLMFSNQGPSSAVLRKKQQPDIAKHNIEALCGSSAAVSGEQKICVTSLQKMMEFVLSCMGSDVKPLFTSAAKWQVYAVTGRATNISDETIGCHKSNIVLPFAIYHCHHINNSIVRAVHLVGEDGIALRVYTVCHLNTTSWDPKHLVFRILNVKPGVPVCHFLTTDDIVWVKK